MASSRTIDCLPHIQGPAAAPLRPRAGSQGSGCRAWYWMQNEPNGAKGAVLLAPHPTEGIEAEAWRTSQPQIMIRGGLARAQLWQFIWPLVVAREVVSLPFPERPEGLRHAFRARRRSTRWRRLSRLAHRPPGLFHRPWLCGIRSHAVFLVGCSWGARGSAVRRAPTP